MAPMVAAVGIAVPRRKTDMVPDPLHSPQSTDRYVRLTQYDRSQTQKVGPRLARGRNNAALRYAPFSKVTCPMNPCP